MNQHTSGCHHTNATIVSHEVGCPLCSPLCSPLRSCFAIARIALAPATTGRVAVAKALKV